MKKPFKIIISFILVASVRLMIQSLTATAASTLDEASFSQQFIEAYTSNDYARMTELIRRAESITFNVIIALLDNGIAELAEEKDGEMYFHAAEIIAQEYVKEFEREGIYKLVKTYKSFSKEEAKDKIRAQELIHEGTSLSGEMRWSEASEKWDSAENISKKIGDVAGEARALGGKGLMYYFRGQFEEALRCLEKSLEMFRYIGDIKMEARSYGAIGQSYYHLGLFDKALRNNEQYLETARRIRDVEGEAEALRNIGQVYSQNDRYDEALRYFEQSREAWQKMSDVRGESNAVGNIAEVYATLDRYNEALRYYKLSLALRQRIVDVRDVRGEAETLNKIGMSYFFLSQYMEATTFLEQGLEIARRNKDEVNEVKALEGLGLVYLNLGRQDEAIRYQEQSLEIARKKKDLAGEAKSLWMIGIAYKRFSRYREALKYHEESLAIARKVSDVSIEFKALTGIGQVYNGLAEYNEGIKYYEQSLTIARKTKNEEDENYVLTNIGLSYYNLGLYSEAIKYNEQSLALARKRGVLINESSVLLKIVDCYSRLGEFKKAHDLAQETIIISERSGNREFTWLAYINFGKVLWESGKGEEAVRHFDKALEIIDEIFRQTKGLKEEERTSMIAERNFVYQEFIKLLLEVHRKFPSFGYDRKAFSVSEKAKSHIFQEMLWQIGARTVLSEDQSFKKMIEKEQQLIADITSLRGLLTKEMSKPEEQKKEEVVKYLKEQLSKAERALQDFEKEIEIKYPRYADLKRPNPLSVEDIQRILKPDETLVSFAIGKDKTVVFVIGKKSFKLVEINIAKQDLTELVKNFRKGLDDVSEETWMEDLEKFKPEIAYELYEKIFQLVAVALKDVKKLYISADDVLYTLPFEALVDEAFDQTVFEKVKKEQKAYLGEFGTLHYLIDNSYTITYLPSASVLRSLRKYEKKGYGTWQTPLIAYADPIFSENEEQQDDSGVATKGIVKKGVSNETAFSKTILLRSTGRGDLPRLKDSADEAKAISRAVGGKEKDIYLREKATEENVYSTDLKKARYILFSTHGLLGGDFREGVAEPALVLTLVGNPPGRDGFLTMSKVLGLNLNAEEVILSACNTSGQGEKAGQGEGFAGLTRSFMYAGTKSILVTHWSVDSQAAKDLMVDMFIKMEKQSKPEALRKAKLKMKESTRDLDGVTLSLSHPFFWAPFVLVGEGQ